MLVLDSLQNKETKKLCILNSLLSLLNKGANNYFLSNTTCVNSALQFLLVQKMRRIKNYYTFQDLNEKFKAMLPS